jgi:anti-sigma regulatory factor (Ser/Thr protein kinase)
MDQETPELCAVLRHPASSRSLRIPLPADPIASEQARRLADHVLLNWGLPALMDSARVVVSELVTNALVLNEPFQLGLHRHGDALMIEVTDRNLGIPKVKQPDTDAEDGRGMLMVECIAEEWNIREEEDGAKTVWAVVAK